MERKETDIDRLVIKLQKDIDSKEFEQFIKDYNPFIVSTISKRLNRYIEQENDPAYSVGINAFYKAVKKYDINKGSFLNFAKTIIDNSLINYVKKEEKNYEELNENQIDDKSLVYYEQIALSQEIDIFEKELLKFGIDFDDLVKESPKHSDTRKRAKEIAIKTYNEKDFVRHIFKKKRLPVTKMCRKFFVTRKVIYGSYDYIIAVIVVLEKKIELVKEFI